ncbi:LytR C-terminal domain-containing protein [Nocardioides jiangxiensis]|uniref:LytR C-terminal domain-containing protein n=1 Tax=Nocardioides jiangxiensis TaxID=3064524 RepID=A0ABT9B0J1_9ACTN|nr:LytR C-terminal domain-containing protein [Nocardioides sp. WY-20]MDO7867763.1 LytR C-terminal domain-containing protein [Nocardioides sp. WY-20]
MARRTRDEQGAAAPSFVVVLSVVAVAMAGIALIAKHDSGDDLEPVARPTTSTTVVESGSPSVAPTASVAPKPVKRNEVNVEVYNTSSIKKLAARTAEKASTLGWQVLGTDNWPGSVPAPTVYYGPRLEAAAKLLGQDLGIRRIRPAVDPMKPDRITVILDRTYVEG